MLKAAIITDIHAGPDVYASGGQLIKSGASVPFVLDHFIEAVKRADIDCVMELGDRISGRGKLQDQFNMALVQQEMNRLTVPHYYIPGNNEYSHLIPAEIEAVTGMTTRTYCRKIGGVQVVFWNPNVRINDGLKLAPEDLQDLKSVLARRPDMPSIVCTHIPLDNNSEKRLQKKQARGLPDNDGAYGNYHYINAHEARQIIEDHGNVILCLAGHRHRTKEKTIKGIPYVTIDSPVGLRKPDHIVRGTFAFLTVDPEKGRADLDIRGRHGEKMHFTF